MQRSSESIANLAAALAKAQGELVNPEKSLVATIRVDGPAKGERSFRYASLSSGLDIVRKTLGQHEIAILQTTSLDKGAGIINLSTMLAHASGEWISSDWPVCAISESANPHRLGAALTYARRYALFTLAGIAGEDDLDAPDLVTPSAPMPDPGKGNGHAQPNGARGGSPRQPLSRRQIRNQPQSTQPMLGAEASAGLRDQFLAEINELHSSDTAAFWAHRRLSQKNRLTAADALRVEQAFHDRLAFFRTNVDVTSDTRATPKVADTHASESLPPPARSHAIDKSVLALAEPRRMRDRGHVKFVAKQACLICGRQPSDAHHLRFAQSKALARKVSDEFTVPLCRGHHRELHRCGDEVAWWKKAGIEPMSPARDLWLQTHPLLTAEGNAHVV